jgi:hypothetical protein
VLAAIVAVAYLPLTLLGYGTDIDVPNVLRAGRSWLDGGPYGMSRRPGAAIHEVATAALDEVGGSVLVNLASVAFAALALWALHDLLRREGSQVAGLAVLVLASNPWFWIAATSLADFVWSLALVLTGAAAARRDHRVLAGLLFGLAIGCRLSSGFLVVAWLVSERAGGRSQRAPWRSVVTTGAAAAAVGALCFVPSWVQFDHTLEFLDSDLAAEGLGVHLGRWLVKNAAFIGLPAAVVLAGGAPRLARACRGWRVSTPLRFALLALVVTEVLYLRYPLKPLHLLPVAACLALLVGHLRLDARRWLAALILAQVVGGLVGTTIASPDVEDRATTGQLELGPTTGPLLTDIQCRLDDRDDGPYDEPGSDAARARAGRNAACQMDAWRAEPDP